MAFVEKLKDLQHFTYNRLSVISSYGVSYHYRTVNDVAWIRKLT